MIVASAGGRGAAGTGSRAASVSDYEQLVLNLMSVDADSTSPYWNDACLLHIKDPSLSRPLTTLHSDELQKKALDMFKASISFSGSDLNPVEYRIWGEMQQRFYQRKFYDVYEPKQHILYTACGLEQSIISDTINKWHKHLCASIHVKGGHKHLQYDTIRYDSVCLTCSKKLTGSDG